MGQTAESGQSQGRAQQLSSLRVLLLQLQAWQNVATAVILTTQEFGRNDHLPWEATGAQRLSRQTKQPHNKNDNKFVISLKSSSVE